MSADGTAAELRCKLRRRLMKGLRQAQDRRLERWRLIMFARVTLEPLDAQLVELADAGLFDVARALVQLGEVIDHARDALRREED
jgi:hypothetical protein